MTAKKQRKIFLIACTALFAALAFFEPAYGWKAKVWLTAQSNANAADPGGAPDLVAQNESLKAQLAQFAAISSELPVASPDYMRAMVYSRYPWNFKNELTVNVGADDGVAVGKAAVFNGILIGTVSQVFPHEAIIDTVFDGDLKLPIRIGAGGYDSLLVGGSSPEATIISKKSQVAPGDIAYSAAPGIPYGLPVGIVSATTTSADNLFQEASLNFAYDINTVETLLIAK